MLHPKQQYIEYIYGKEPETLDEIAEACIAVIAQRSVPVPVVGFAWDISYDRTVSNSHHAPVNGYTNWGGQNNHGDTRNYPGFSGRVWIRYAESPNFMQCSDNFEKTLTFTGTGGGGSYDGLWTPISTATYLTRYRKNPSDCNSKFIYKYPDPKCFSWDYRFFLEDFPGINKILGNTIRAHEEQENKNEVWARVNAKYYRRQKFTLDHKFKWEDPKTKAADEAFLKEYQKSLAKVSA